MGLDHMYGVMALSTKEGGSKATYKVTESINGQMGGSTKVIGKIIICMEWES